MAGNQKIEDIVLYHGSLRELNSRNPDIQYTFAESKSWIYYYQNFSLDQAIEQTKIDLKAEGYDGLVNRKTCSSGQLNINSSFIVEGTPIVRHGK